MKIKMSLNKYLKFLIVIFIIELEIQIFQKNILVLNSLLDKFVPQEDKTNNAYVPESFLFSPSLWRGILDGDGCCGYRKETPYIGFTTKSESLKDAFCILVEQIVGQKIIATRNKRDNVYNLGVTSVNAKILAEWLLSVDTFYIKRKKEMLEEIAKW